MTNIKIRTYRSQDKEICQWSKRSMFLFCLFSLATSKTKMHLEGPRCLARLHFVRAFSKCNDCWMESVSWGTISCAQFLKKEKSTLQESAEVIWPEIISSETFMSWFMIPLQVMAWHAGWPKFGAEKDWVSRSVDTWGLPKKSWYSKKKCTVYFGVYKPWAFEALVVRTPPHIYNAHMYPQLYRHVFA